MILYVCLKASNKKSILYFLFLIINFSNNLIKLKNYKKRLIQFNILRSPHIHKKTQQNIKLNRYKKNIFFLNFDNKITFFLKKIKLFLFQDVDVKYNLFLLNSFIFNFKHIKLNYFKKRKKKNFLKFLYFNNFYGKCFKTILISYGTLSSKI